MAPLLSVENLSVDYQTRRGPVRALDRLSLTLEEGGSLGLVGESGSGKSTAALALIGLLDDAARLSGRLLYRGDDLARLSPAGWRRLRGSRIAMVFQDPFTTLNPALRIGAQIGEPLVHHHGLRPAAALRRARELLAEVGIADPAMVAAAYPHQLSGGMRQRALIAAALAGEPELLILDEPTTALDVTIEAQILDLLLELRRRRRMALLFISHNLGTVRRICEEVAVIYAGRLVEQGPTRQLFAAPHHPYAKGLLAALPRLGQRRRRLAPIPGGLPDAAAPPPGCSFAPRCPFATKACATTAQDLVASAPRRQVRCMRHGDIRDRPWPVPDEETPPVPRAPSGEAPIVATTELTKHFRRGGFLGLGSRIALTAVDRVTLEIRPGEVLGLVGESGSGKTTLGRLILRLLAPSSGTIRVAGTEVATAGPAALMPVRRLAQIVFQNPDSALNPRRSVGELIARPLRRFAIVPRREVPERVEALLDRVRLPAAYAARYPHQLSGGEKQRVGIARAIASQPRFLVCDEPVSALDVSVQAAILNLLADLRDATGAAYLFISHDIAVVAHLADRIAVMYRGAICEEGPTAAVLAPPYHPYTALLLSSVPSLEEERPPGRHGPAGAVPGGGSPGIGCRFHARCPRKLGSICETVAPPVGEAVPGHRIACHIPAAELARIQPVI